LKAVAYNSSGAAYNETISVNIQNSTPTPTVTPTPTPTVTPTPTPTVTPTPTPTVTPPPTSTVTPTPAPAPSTSSLPADGTKAINTFHSIGLYWTPPSNPGAAGCQVRYRKSGDADWKEALPMWYDSRNSECRGSIVQVEQGTNYDVQFSMPGQSPMRELKTTTWSESFPIAKVVYLNSGNQQVNITQGGSASGYVLYTSAPGSQAVIDVANNADYNVAISAPYVIVRGLVLKGGRIDGIRLLPGSSDVVIEDNDISGWGRPAPVAGVPWTVGVEMDSAIRAHCRTTPFVLERTVVQRNKLHDPRYGANTWDWGHPNGPQAITYSYCGGNHVFRYNEISSSEGHYFNDGMGGEDNFSETGFPNADSDIYGNKISQVADDGIESEGGNRNVRIWGNYLDQTATGIASTVVHLGPLYIFRNVYNRSRMLSQTSLDSDDRNSFFKSGAAGGYGNGRRWVFHNTMLLETQAGVTNPLGGGYGLKGNTGQPMTNTVSRNNIFHVWKSGWNSVEQQSGSTGNDADYDLHNGGVGSFAGAEANGMVGAPIYAPGHGWENWAGGYYQLAPNSPGYDRAVRVPNFNDNFTGAAPDVGAHEAGMPPMKFGIQ
jgi:hypothetical protein